MTLEEIEKAIYDEYQNFHTYNPSIRPREAGWLGQLWNAFDYLISTEGDSNEDL